MDIDFSKIETAYKNAPKKVRSALFSPEMASKVRRVAEEFKITDDKELLLLDAVSLSLLRVHRPEHLSHTLQKELALPEQTAQEISRKLQREIFTPLFNQTPAKSYERSDSHEKAGAESNRTSEEAPEQSYSPVVEMPRYMDDEKENRPQHDEQRKKPEQKQRPFDTDPYREPLE